MAIEESEAPFVERSLQLARLINPRRVKYDELLRALKRAGYKEQRQRGSHIRLWRESDKRQITTVLSDEDAL